MLKERLIIQDKGRGPLEKEAIIRPNAEIALLDVGGASLGVRDRDASARGF